MRDYLKGQMQGRNIVENHEKEMNQAVETKLINDAMKRVQIRENNREKWLKQQMKNSNYLNNLNNVYKHKLNNDGLTPTVQGGDFSNENMSGYGSPANYSNLKKPDFDLENGVMKVYLDKDYNEKMRQERTKINAN